MVGYPYIQDLFQAVLEQSKVIGGRFHVCPRWGGELNNINIEEALQVALPKVQKYPCALLMPMHSMGNYQFSGDEVTGNTAYEQYQVAMLFLMPAYYTGQNQVSSMNVATNQSGYTIQQTWDDMKRCAVDFMAALRQVLVYNGITDLIIPEQQQQIIEAVTNLSNDQVSGVFFRFSLAANKGCEIGDYEEGYLGRIVVPNPLAP